MKSLIVASFGFFVLFQSINCQYKQNVNEFRVMTFNIWLSGQSVENGLQKIAKHILMVNPDVVALQETYSFIPKNLTKMLGKNWNIIVHPSTGYPDTAIITRHAFFPKSIITTSHGVGAKIMLRTGEIIHFWSLHLHYSSYGPYAAYNKMVTNISQIMAGENLGRRTEIIEILNHRIMKKWMSKVSDIPIIIAGDFNGPSHLDWMSNRKIEHGGWVVEWPATKLLENAGFIDSYREIYPDPVADPGYTWSTVNKFNPEWNYTIPEPQDRIDFIFYQGPIIPFKSVTYCGYEKLKRIPFHKNNDYPSDHFAVLTDFQFFF